MLTVKEDGLREPDSLLDLVHHMLMVYWTAGVHLYPAYVLVFRFFLLNVCFAFVQIEKRKKKLLLLFPFAYCLRCESKLFHFGKLKKKSKRKEIRVFYYVIS